MTKESLRKYSVEGLSESALSRWDLYRDKKWRLSGVRLWAILSINVSLSKSDAELVEVVSMNEYQHEYGTITDTESQVNTLTTLSHEDFIRFAKDRGKTINIALVGNPNCGKTSMFNFASGAYEHVGNYSGVTVDAKEEVFTQDEYTFKIIDLPGTYSLSTYILEELYVRKYLKED